jgi:predicted RNA-binding protein YlqC (UPF0109 family)
MFSSRSAQKPPSKPSIPAQVAMPDYAALVRFLVQPFLESPSSLKIDCETNPSKPKVWIRLAFEGEDKGRVFGRGGRNIQAIRTVIEAAAKAAGQSVYLDIYGGIGPERENGAGIHEPPTRSSPPRKAPVPRSSPRIRFRS